MRNWQDGRLKVVIELAGAGAVLLGLIFVGLELRQNTDAVRSATIQEIIRWSYDGTVVMIENPELREAYRQSCTGTLSQDQQQLLFNLYVGALRIQLNRYHQARLGIIDEDLALSLGGRATLYRSPIFADVWTSVRENFSPEFQGFVESQVLPMVEESCDPAFMPNA